MKVIYLDNNATTPLASVVADAIARCLKDNFGNPSSGHVFGIKAKKAIEKARGHVAGLIGAEPDEIVFTSGGTESNNLAIFGTLSKYKSGHIISSCIEHPSVSNPLKQLESMGFRVTYLRVDKYGFVNPDDVAKSITKNTRLITVMHSNNETGTIQPIAEIGRIANDRGIPFHCDAAQSVGKVPVNVIKLNTDLLTIVSHKFYGPKGVGALYKKDGIELSPIIYGASHEKGLRPGTENVAGIIGLGKTSELAKRELTKRVRHMKDLTKLLLNELRRQIPGIKLNGHPSKRLPNTLNLSFPNISGSLLLAMLKKEIAASTGSACHEGSDVPSPVLKAMGASDKDALSAVRLSLGRDNREGEIKRAAKAIVDACRKMNND